MPLLRSIGLVVIVAARFSDRLSFPALLIPPENVRLFPPPRKSAPASFRVIAPERVPPPPPILVIEPLPAVDPITIGSAEVIAPEILKRSLLPPSPLTTVLPAVVPNALPLVMSTKPLLIVVTPL